jgi:riboflavin biosynthesis pyrimidine reductase
MGLLRATADAVLVGCGTVNASPKGHWRPDTVFPGAAGAFGELRDRPARVVVATELAADRLAGRLPEETEIAVVPGDDAVDVAAAVSLLRERGHRRILSEAGPRLFGSLVAADLVDELFLTVSPLLAGRAAGEERFGIVEGVSLLPERERRGSLRSARLHGGHLFLRYAF